MALAQRLWKAMSRQYQKNAAGRVFPRPPPPTAGAAGPSPSSGSSTTT